MTSSTVLIAQRAALAQRGRRLEYFTIAWNSLEGLVAVVAGAFAGSISLVGFGIDGFIEVTSGIVLLWRMAVDADERNEERSLRIVGVCFFALAVYVAYESISDLVSRKAPEHSVPGILLACVSLIVMPLLSRAKKKVAKELGSAAMHAAMLKRLISACTCPPFCLSGCFLTRVWGGGGLTQPTPSSCFPLLLRREWRPSKVKVAVTLAISCFGCAQSVRNRPELDSSELHQSRDYSKCKSQKILWRLHLRKSSVTLKIRRASALGGSTPLPGTKIPKEVILILTWTLMMPKTAGVHKT